MLDKQFWNISLLFIIFCFFVFLEDFLNGLAWLGLAWLGFSACLAFGFFTKKNLSVLCCVCGFLFLSVLSFRAREKIRGGGKRARGRGLCFVFQYLFFFFFFFFSWIWCAPLLVVYAIVLASRTNIARRREERERERDWMRSFETKKIVFTIHPLSVLSLILVHLVSL